MGENRIRAGGKWKEVGKETRRQNNIGRRERGKQKFPFTVGVAEAED